MSAAAVRPLPALKRAGGAHWTALAWAGVCTLFLSCGGGSSPSAPGGSALLGTWEGQANISGGSAGALELRFTDSPTAHEAIGSGALQYPPLSFTGGDLNGIGPLPGANGNGEFQILTDTPCRLDVRGSGEVRGNNWSGSLAIQPRGSQGAPCDRARFGSFELQKL